VFLLEVSAKAIERAPGLALGDATNERAADYRSDRSERCTEFISVVKPRATVLRGEAVLRVRAGACRSTTLPDGQLLPPALDELPVNLDVDASEVYLLVHLISHPRGALVGME
jgi:hypothetical protein